MAWSIRGLLAVAGLFASVNAAAIAQTSSACTSATASTSTPIPPHRDPWYTATHDFATKQPGAVLKVRPAPGNLTHIAANASASYNVMYRTTDSRYNATWAVTTIFVPKKPVNGTSALLSYQTPYDSAFVDASPSYALYSGVSTDISGSLGKGWFVSVPDYEGPLASFTAGVMSGHATLDSIRAILELAELGIVDLSQDVRYALWGYSGGALASEWAAELQVQYAPELNFSGVALGGLTPNVTSVLLTINKSAAAGLGPAAILGITSQYPEVQQYVISQLNETGQYNKTTFLGALNSTLSQTETTFIGQDLSKYFKGGFASILENPATQKVVFSDGIMGYHGVPQMPIFAYKAIKDEISPVADTDKLINEYCNLGANILYHRNTISGHVGESINGEPAAQAWLNSVLGGTYAKDFPTQGCSISNTNVNITNTSLRKRNMFAAWLPQS